MNNRIWSLKSYLIIIIKIKKSIPTPFLCPLFLVFKRCISERRKIEMKKDVNFEETLLLLGREVIHTLIKKGSSLEDAEDAVSKTYTTIFSSLVSITQKNLRPWFFRVSFNNYIDVYRKKRREQEYVSNYIEFSGALTSDSQTLWLMIDSLKRDEQEVLILKYYYQLSYEEIGSILDMNVENVKKKLYRIRKKLKNDWEDGQWI